MHSQIIFCMKATLIVHPRIMKIYKNFPGNITNNFPYQNIILSLRNAFTNNFLYAGNPNSTPYFYLFGHYNLLQVLASANLRRHTSRAIAAWRQFRIPSVVTFSFISSALARPSFSATSTSWLRFKYFTN